MTRDLRLELHQMVAIGNEFVNKIYGFVYEPPRIFAVSTYCSRKSLKEILENGQLRLENMFIVSFIMDILKGLKYLHQSPLGFHGNLKSKTCLVDATWRVLLANFGMVHMREGETDNNDSDLMWTAPELLRRNNKKTDMSKISLQHADVYSFGIILHEILSRAGPWGGAPFSCSEILEQLKYPTDDDYYRPNLKLIKNPHPAALETCKACWEEEPELRPKVQKVKKMLQPLAKGMKGNIADNLMSLLDRYKNNLLDVVEEKIAQLNEERMRSERLLLQMLPAQVAHALKNGLTVEAEHYPSVTIYFSDIVGFTHMSSESTPMQVVHFLNDLYTVFDTILDDFDVYKVETIGDAYMMASGVPLANGINHAGEIASTALRLLESITDFKITHRPNDPLKLRMGIHSGSVVTGVVGVKMPRYCLFGSSVTFASQMESYGLRK
uniref:guanylate cyclase n=1 Tax=Plectus sambesii TaxID=2011161 RepID=A0A914UKT5_9BILA